MKFLELIIKLFPAICHLLRAVTGRKPNRGTVLIVDDCADDALILSIVLKKLNYGSEIADSANTARVMAGRSEYSYIFVDLRLPDLPGQALVRMLNNESPRSKIVIVTGADKYDLIGVPDGDYAVVVKKGVNFKGLSGLMKMLGDT